MEHKEREKKSNPAALLPILIFLVLYLGLGYIFEYRLKIEMGFYSIPIVVVFLVALLVACLSYARVPFDKWFKFILPFQGIAYAVSAVLLVIASFINY